jgi:hypothetical protein
MAASGPLALTSEINAFRAQFEQISADADQLASPLSDAQFTWQPSPESWSVAQCLDHLNATAREYLPMLDEGIADAIRRGLYNPGPYTYNWIGRLMAWIVDPDTRIRARAPKGFLPPAGRPRHDVMAAFRAYQCSTSIVCGRRMASISPARGSPRQPRGGFECHSAPASRRWSRTSGGTWPRRAG